MAENPITIINNKDRQRFEAKIDDDYAYIDYRMHDGQMVLMHTFVPVKLRGKHIADELARFALAYLEKEKIPAKIYCPFVTAYIQRHPEYQHWKSKLTKDIQS